MSQTIEVDSGRIKFVVGLVILLIVIGIVASSAIAIVPAGHRGVLLHFDKVDVNVNSLDEGIHFIMPIQDKVVPIEIRIKELTQGATSASNDLQDVSTTITLNYHLDPNSVNQLYKDIGLSYEGRVIVPAIQETVKAVTAEFNAEELVTKRPIVKDTIHDRLLSRLSGYDIMVDVVSITEFRFSPEFTQAIEKKVTAEQRALEEQNNIKIEEAKAQQQIAIAHGQAESQIEVAEGDKQSAILRAEGDAEAIALRTQALNELYLDWLRTSVWNGELPDTLVTGDNGAIPFINIPAGKSVPATP